MTPTARDALLAELHRKRAAIDAEIAEVYAGNTKPRRPRRALVAPTDETTPENIERVSRALARRGIR